MPLATDFDLEIRIFAELPHENKLLGVTVLNLESYKIGNDNLISLTSRMKKEALLAINLKLSDVDTLPDSEDVEIFETKFNLENYTHKKETKIIEHLGKQIALTKKKYMELVDSAVDDVATEEAGTHTEENSKNEATEGDNITDKEKPGVTKNESKTEKPNKKKDKKEKTPLQITKHRLLMMGLAKRLL